MVRGSLVGKFLVTGTGRSGTMSLARALSAIGITTGHEEIYAPGGYLHTAWPTYDGDASWLALPLLASGRALIPPRAVHVTRDPRAVIASRAEIGFVERDAHAMKLWRPDLFFSADAPEPERLEKTCEIYCALIDVAEMLCDETFQIEEIEGDEEAAAEFLAAIGHHRQWDGSDFLCAQPHENAREDPSRLGWADLPGEVRLRGARLGYTEVLVDR